MSEGRVEIKFDHSWGTICDDHWTLREANVVCRSMGFGTAAGATTAAYFGKGVGKVSNFNWLCKFIITVMIISMQEGIFYGYHDQVQYS